MRFSQALAFGQSSLMHGKSAFHFVREVIPNALTFPPPSSGQRIVSVQELTGQSGTAIEKRAIELKVLFFYQGLIICLIHLFST